MKKIIFILTIMMMFGSSVFGYSSGFEYMLKNLEIAVTNINGHFINEDIYNQYNLLVYGSPLIITQNQRWKTVDNGNWQQNGGAWNGRGVRGEYWILGETYAGKEVHNEIFPDDYNSNTSPIDWNYVEIDDAEQSWSDVEKYQTDIQKDYMLNQKLSRNNVTYDLTALDIGTNKARAESYATWKTKGSIYTKKIDANGIYWGATFNVPPMAADAKLNANLNLTNGLNYTIKEEQNEIYVNIDYGANISNMSEYVSKDDIKKISAELVIDGLIVDSVKGSGEIDILKQYVLKINKSNYPNQDSVEIHIECNAVAETCFEADIPMYDSKDEIIIIKIQKEEEINKVKDRDEYYEYGKKPEIVSIEVKRVTIDEYGNECYEDLLVANRTDLPFICAGQVIYIRVKTINDAEDVILEFEGDKSITTLDDLTKKFEWDEPRARGVKTRFSTLKKLQNQYRTPLLLTLEQEANNGVKYFSTTYVIPYKTKQTLNSWETLREENKNAFEIDKKKLFTRIEKPYSLVLKAKSDIGISTERTKIDVFEAWNKLYNRDLTKYIKDD